MRPRFSLRTMLIATTACGCFLYYWIVMPGHTAARFVRSIGAEDFSSADRMFWKSGDRVLTQWKEKYWGLRADAVLLPCSFGQFVSGQRDVRLHVAYFYLDEHHDLDMQLAATHLESTRLLRGLAAAPHLSIKFSELWIKLSFEIRLWSHT